MASSSADVGPTFASEMTGAASSVVVCLNGPPVAGLARPVFKLVRPDNDRRNRVHDIAIDAILAVEEEGRASDVMVAFVVLFCEGR